MMLAEEKVSHWAASMVDMLAVVKVEQMDTSTVVTMVDEMVDYWVAWTAAVMVAP